MHLLAQTVFYFIDTVLKEYKCRGRPNFFSHEALVVGLSLVQSCEIFVATQTI